MRTRYHLVQFTNKKYGVRRVRSYLFGSIKIEDYCSGRDWIALYTDYSDLISYTVKGAAIAAFMNLMKDKSLQVETVLEELQPPK